MPAKQDANIPLTTDDLNIRTTMGIASGAVQVLNLTFSAATVTGNTVTTVVRAADDSTVVNVSEAFDTNSNTTLANIATAIATHAKVATAVVTDGGAGTDDDREIVITASANTEFVQITDILITGGATQTVAKVTTSTTGQPGAGIANVEFIGQAVSGASSSNHKWQLKRFTYDAANNVISSGFARKDNKPYGDSSYKFSWNATAQVQEIIVTGEFIAGNTALVLVDGVAVTQAFSTDHTTTMSSWATSIAGESSVTTATVRSPNVIIVTAATAGIPVILSEPQTTGTVINSSMTIRETVPNQESHENLVYGS